MKSVRILIIVVLSSLTLFPASLKAQEFKKLSAQAMEAYNKKEYEKSAGLFTLAIQQGDDDVNTFYNAACSFALAGKKAEAFQYLEQAINSGYSNVQHLQNDSDLNSLHAEARWQALIEKATAILQAYEKFWNNPALKTTYRDNLSEDEKVAGLSKLWAEAKYNFAYFDHVPELDWDATYLAYLPRVRQTGSTFEYYRVLMELCAKLKDGHTGVYPPNELVNSFYARPAVRTRLVEDKVVLIAVVDEQLRRQGLASGQELLEIDGIPAKPYAEEKVRPYQSSSTPQDSEVRSYEYALLSGAVNDSVKLTLKDKSGKILKATLPRLTCDDRAKLMPARPPMEFKLLPGNIAYVALNTFENNQTAEQFEANFDAMAKSDALIIDVRENGGGNSNFGYRVLQCLTDKPFKTSRWQTRNYLPAYRAWGRPEGKFSGEVFEVSPNGTRLYAKPIVVLISPRTFSAAEDFCVAFDAMERGLMIGEPTGGSTGQPLFFNLPGGGSARICTKRDTYPDGREFVGVGIQPDKVVRPTLADMRAGRDTVLEAALKELKASLQKRHAPSKS